MSNNTIKLAVYGIPPVELEILASGTITPGMLVARTPADTCVAHNASGGFVSPKLVAVENLMEGKAISDNYLSGEKVFIIAARPGDQMWLWLAMGATTAIGDLMVSDGAGMLGIAGVGPHTDGSIVGSALEIVDASAAAARIRVEIA